MVVDQGTLDLGENRAVLVWISEKIILAAVAVEEAGPVETTSLNNPEEAVDFTAEVAVEPVVRLAQAFQEMVGMEFVCSPIIPEAKNGADFHQPHFINQFLPTYYLFN